MKIFIIKLVLVIVTLSISQQLLNAETVFQNDKSIMMTLYTRGIKGDLPVTVGVPIPAGILRDTNNLALSAGGKEIYAQRAVTARWHTDNSIKWVQLDFIIPSVRGLSTLFIFYYA